jgi:hypothetical protein
MHRRPSLKQVATGELTPAEAADLSKLVESYARVLQAMEFRIRKIIVHEGDDVHQVIKDMEARGEIPAVPADFPAGHISTIVHTIVDWPKRDKQMSH